MSWHGTREEAMVVIRDTVRRFRNTDRNTEADALEYVFLKCSRDDSAEHFRTVGAGEVEVGRSIDRCGSELGVYFGVE